MPKLNTTVKSVRIDNYKLAELEKKLGGKTINAWLNERIDEFLGLSTKNPGVISGKPQKIDEKSVLSHEKELKEIESMAKFFGLTTEDVLKGIFEGLNDGYLTVEGGKIVGVPEVDLTELEEAARERNMTIEVVIDRTIKNLRSGK